MAQGMKELRRRIRSVTSIQKITRAMEMVATTRLRRMQMRAEGARPYADAIKGFSALLAGGGKNLVSPLTLARPKVSRIALLLVSSDRGLCGAYNANLFRKASLFLNEKIAAAKAAGIDLGVDLYVLGKKAKQHYAKRMTVKVAYPDEVEKLTARRAREITRELTDAFLTGGVDEIHLLFTRFISVGRQLTTVDRLLPVTADEAAKQDVAKGGAAVAGSEQILLEPSPQELFDALLPKSLAMRVYAALLDSMASEQAARRMAMKAATDAAGEMIGALTRKYNRARQETITKELLDIVGGAEALA